MFLLKHLLLSNVSSSSVNPNISPKLRNTGKAMAGRLPRWGLFQTSPSIEAMEMESFYPFIPVVFKL